MYRVTKIGRIESSEYKKLSELIHLIQRLIYDSRHKANNSEDNKVFNALR